MWELFLCGGCVCYCVEVVFVIVWGLCLLSCGGCVCYCVGVVFVIVWGLCLLSSSKYFVCLFEFDICSLGCCFVFASVRSVR